MSTIQPPKQSLSDENLVLEFVIEASSRQEFAPVVDLHAYNILISSWQKPSACGFFSEGRDITIPPENPLVSIVLPSADRTREVMDTVVAIASLDLVGVEIVISDNAHVSRTELRELTSYSSVRYVRPSKPLHMTDNFEFACANASGDWSMLIGSDDGIQIANLADYLNLLASSSTGVVTGPAAHFTWPSATSEGIGRLSWWLPDADVAELSIRETAIIRRFHDRSMLRAPRVPRRSPFIPFVYMFGAIRSDVQRRLRTKGSGRLFRTVTPDWYLAMAVTAHSEAYEYCPLPIGIQGISSASNGLKSSTKWREWLEQEAVRPALEGTGTQAFGDMRVPSYTLAWLDIWATIRGVEAVSDSDQRIRLAAWVALNTPNEKIPTVMRYLIDLWPQDRERIRRVFEIYKHLHISRIRDLAAKAVRVGSPMLAGGTQVVVEGPGLEKMSDAMHIVPEVQNLLRQQPESIGASRFKVDKPMGSDDLSIRTSASPIRFRSQK